jgi:hypothetical protein
MDKDSDVAESSSKVRLVSADSRPPPWAHVLFEKISALETRISQLHITMLVLESCLRRSLPMDFLS